MGRRRKKRRVVLKRTVKIPRIFQCPNCTALSLSILIKRHGDNTSSAIVSCGNCGLYDNEDFLNIPSVYQAVDIYAKFIDLFEKGEAKIKFLKPTTGEGEG
ncbi:MAG: hypothetical protein QXP02_00135 [Desulfurococcaceae archaeon]